jgi:hypothetical protein
MTPKPAKTTNVPFLYRHAEDVPRETGPRATFQRETVKNEGQ